MADAQAVRQILRLRYRCLDGEGRVRRLLRENGLAIVVFGLFFTFLAIESVVGARANNQERAEHGQPPQSYLEFVTSGDFIESTTENWESEFLEMAGYVVFTTFLFQKGSAESKRLGTPEKVDRDPRESAHKPHVPWPVRRGGWVLRVYENSLSLALLLLFLISFMLHATGGMRAYNEDQMAHGQPPVTLGEFMRSSQFWFQSMQNWQSEFLGLGSMVVLTIFLRQRGSPESKPVDAAHSDTGSG